MVCRIGVREAPRRRPGGGAGGGHGVLRDEPSGRLNWSEIAPFCVGGDVDVSTPCLARVVVDADVHGFARGPVGARERDLLARRVVGLVGPHRGGGGVSIAARPLFANTRAASISAPNTVKAKILRQRVPVFASSPQLSRLYSSPVRPSAAFSLRHCSN